MSDDRPAYYGTSGPCDRLLSRMVNEQAETIQRLRSRVAELEKAATVARRSYYGCRIPGPGGSVEELTAAGAAHEIQDLRKYRSESCGCKLVDGYLKDECAEHRRRSEAFERRFRQLENGLYDEERRADAMQARADKAEGERLVVEEALNKAQVQLAGCGVAASGGTNVTSRVSRGDYGWSRSYQDVLELAIERDNLKAQITQLGTALHMARDIEKGRKEQIEKLQRELGRLLDAVELNRKNAEYWHRIAQDYNDARLNDTLNRVGGVRAPVKIQLNAGWPYVLEVKA